MGKSVVATLVGVAIKQGKIRSLDDLITQYEPDLKGTAWDGVTLRQLITHTSGVAWNEDYTNPKSDFAQLTECEARPGTYACVRKLVAGLQRAHPAGQNWSYLRRRVAAGRRAGARHRHAAGGLSAAKHLAALRHGERRRGMPTPKASTT